MPRKINDFYWLAGWLEGEGYFGIGKANGNRSKSLTFKISVGSTDYDVVERASIMELEMAMLEKDYMTLQFMAPQLLDG